MQGQTITKLVFIICLFALLFKLNLSWGQVSVQPAKDATVDGERTLVINVGNPFQTHYFFAGNRGSNCKNMTKYFNKKVLAKWHKNEAVKADKLDLELLSCREVKNTITVGSPLENQLEVQVALVGLCPRKAVTFKSINFIDDTTVDIYGVQSPFLKHVGIQTKLVPNKQIGSMVLTNAMEITVPGCN